MRGIRGAITVEENTAEAIREATRKVVYEMITQNHIATEDIGAAIFSATDDLTAAFPASGARSLPGFDMVPLFDARQMDVENAMKMCIRVLLLVDTETRQRDIRHIFLGKAANLRPDIAEKQ